MKSYGGTIQNIQNAGTQRYGRTKKTRGGKRDENERTYIIYKNRKGKGKRRRKKKKNFFIQDVLHQYSSSLKNLVHILPLNQ